MFRKQKILMIIIFGLSLVYTKITFAQQPQSSTTPTTPPPTAPVEKDEEKFDYNKFGIGLFYNFADTPKLKASAPGEDISGDIEFESEGALGLLLYGDKRFNKSWGLEYGVGYEFERTVENIKYQDYQFTNDPNVTLTIFYFQLNGKFFPADNFYILLGFNINSMDLKNSVVDLDMGYGGQLGLGFQISKNFALEGQYQRFYSDYNDTGVGQLATGQLVTITADGFSLDGVKIILRYSF